MEKYKDFIKRFRKLSGIEDKNAEYLIKITLCNKVVAESLSEHYVYQNFIKSNNRFTYHAEKTNPPVKAHYHIYPNNSSDEIYAVNTVDGKAHHKSNRGHKVPRQEAEELRKLGVKLPDSNILETKLFSDIPDLNNLYENTSGVELFYILIK